MSDEVNPSPSFGSRLGRALVIILRILLVLVILGGLAAAVYYGSPYVYNRFILPVENNTARLAEVEGKQASDAKKALDQMAELKTRLAELENRQTEAAQTLAEVQGKVAALETALDTQTATLNQLASMQTSLETLKAAYDENQATLAGNVSALADLKRQITLSRAIELLSRARLYLSQSNFGMAKEDVGAAQGLLITLQPDMPADKAEALKGVITRLDLALGNLPIFPVVAVDDVDIAWQLLVNGLPEQPPVTLMPEEAAETPAPSIEITPTTAP